MPLPPPSPRSGRHRSSAASATKTGAVAEAVGTTLREWFQQATGGHQQFPGRAATPAVGAEAIVDAVLRNRSAHAAGPAHSRRLSASLESTASNATDAPTPAPASGSAANTCERDPLRDLVARLLVLTSLPAVAANPATVSVAPPSERSGRATHGNGEDEPAVVRRASPNPTNASADAAAVVRRDPVRLGPVAVSKRRTIGSGGIRPTVLAGRLRPAVSVGRAAAPAGDTTGKNRRSPDRVAPTVIKTVKATTVARTDTGLANKDGAADAPEVSPRSIANSSPDVLHPMRTTNSIPGQELPPAAVSSEAWAPVALSENVHCGRDDGDDDDDDDQDSLSHDSQEGASHDVPVTRHADTRGGSSDDSGSSCGSSGDEDIVSELNQFVLLERLGRGSQGEVFLAMDTTSSELRAVKAVLRPAQGQRVSAAWQRKLDDLAREVAIMTRLRHRNIVTLHEVIDDPGRDKMYLVLQYIDGGPVAKMDDAGRASATVDPKTLVGLAQQMAAGLQYLHRHGVIHRDVKPENILKGSNGEIYLADFGVSEAFAAAADGTCSGGGHGGEPAAPHHPHHHHDHGRHRQQHRIRGTKGTPAFLAPELLALRAGVDGAPGDDVDGEAVDVWALGITLYALLYGRIPWEFSNARDLFEAIQQRPIELRPAAAASRSITSFLRQSASVVVAATPASSHCTSVERKGSLVEPMPSAAVAAETHRQSAHDTPPLPFPEFNADAESDPQSDDDANGVDGRSRPPAALLDSARGGGLPRPAQFLDSPQWHGSTSSTGGLFAVTSYLDEAWRQLLHSMLQRDPRRRATVPQVLTDLRRMSKRADDASTVLASPGPVANVFTKLR